jgi:hypothetical protein
MPEARMAARDGLLAELPQIFDRASAAHEQQHLAFGAPAGARQHRRDALGRALALHRHRVDDDLDRRIAPRERRQHVAQRSGGERSHDPDAARVRGQLALELLLEQAFGAELFLEAQETLVERAEACAAHGLDRELEASTRLVEGRERANLHLHAVARLPVEERGAAAEHHAFDLGRAILEREIAVARRRAREVGDLATHPGEREAPLEEVAHAAQQFRHRQNA